MSRHPNVFLAKIFDLISTFSSALIGHRASQRHFPRCEWADFVRSLMDQERAGIMQEHLKRGCFSCVHDLGIWRTLVEFASNEANHQPPEWLVRQAKASFPLLRAASRETKSTSAAILVFDNMCQGNALGVRAISTPGRQLLYRSGTTSIDLQISSKRGSDSVVLAGQILDQFRPRRNIPVSLMKGGAPVSRKTTNEFGEFEFAFDTPDCMHLAFDLGDAIGLTVHLPDAFTGHSQLRA